MKLSLKNSNYGVITVGIFILLSCALFFLGSGQFADVLRGYEVMNQMNQGGNFNVLSYPSVESTSYSYFVSWWSEGQWIFIFLLTKIGFSLQFSQAFLSTSLVGIGLIFYYNLFKTIGFSQKISNLSVLLILSTGFVGTQFILFTGGDLFVFALLPLFLRMVIASFSWGNLQFILSFFLISIALCFFKNSFLLVVFCTIMGVWNVKKRSLVILGVVGLMIFSAVYFLHLRMGETPGSAIDLEGYYGIPNSILGDIVHPISSLLNSVLNLDIFLGLIEKVEFLGMDKINFFMIPIAILSVWIFLKIKKENLLFNDQVRFIFFFSIAFILIFVILHFRNSAISYDVRHFAPVMFLLVPLLLELGKKKIHQKFFSMFILLVIISNLGIQVLRVRSFHAEYTFVNGYSLNDSEKKELEMINHWTEKHPHGLVILNERWHFMPMLKAKNKICLQKIGKNYVVVSGMELDHPDQFNIKILDDYKNVYWQKKGH